MGEVLEYGVVSFFFVASWYSFVCSMRRVEDKRGMKLQWDDERKRSIGASSPLPCSP